MDQSAAFVFTTWQRWLMGTGGTALVVVGGVATFVTRNSNGSAALVVLGGGFILLAIIGRLRSVSVASVGLDFPGDPAEAAEVVEEVADQVAARGDEETASQLSDVGGFLRGLYEDPAQRQRAIADVARILQAGNALARLDGVTVSIGPSADLVATSGSATVYIEFVHGWANVSRKLTRVIPHLVRMWVESEVPLRGVVVVLPPAGWPPLMQIPDIPDTDVPVRVVNWPDQTGGIALIVNAVRDFLGINPNAVHE